MCDEKIMKYFYKLPNEIWLNIMIHLSDMSLLDMTRSCWRFQRIAKYAFSKKYNGENIAAHFKLTIFCESNFEEYMRYRPFFLAFGENMIAIEIRFFDESLVARNHWLVKMITSHCTSLQRISLQGGVQLDLTEIVDSIPIASLTHLKLNGVRFTDQSWANIHYPKLVSFSTRYALDRNILGTFLLRNQQITHLDFAYCHFDVGILRLISDRLNELISLCIQDFTSILGDRFDLISLPSLESFKLCIDPDTTVDIMVAVSEGCPKLNKLLVEENSHNHISWTDKYIQCYTKMRNIQNLTICSRSLSTQRLKRLVGSLPKLTSLYLKHFFDESDHYESIPEIIAFCTKLTKLRFDVCGHMPDLRHDFIPKIAEISQNNPNLNVRLDRNIQLIFKHGLVRSIDGIIYWNGYDPKFNKSAVNLMNLEENCLEKIIGFLDLNSRCRLYESCKKMQELISKFISNNIFYASLTMNVRIFEILGMHIRALNVEINIVSLVVNEVDEEILDGIEAWRRINQHCPNVTELVITSLFYISQDVYRIPFLSWPKLEKLKFSTPYPVSCSVLRTIDCPQLKYLEIHNYPNLNELDEESTSEPSEWTIEKSYTNLTTIKVRMTFFFQT